MSATEPLVLVVDDDAGSRKAMALTLQTDGRRVEEFTDADAALERAIEDPSVALVVTDLKMPGKSGLDLAADLAAARPDVSVLLVTAHGDVETLLSARTLGTPHAHEKVRVATRRPSARLNACAHTAHFMPNVIGSAWMPCVRPTQSVSLNSSARRVQISMSRRTSARTMSIACVI